MINTLKFNLTANRDKRTMNKYVSHIGIALIGNILFLIISTNLVMYYLCNSANVLYVTFKYVRLTKFKVQF